MTIEQSELREKIAREFRIAILEFTAPDKRVRRDELEDSAYLHADVVMALIERKDTP